MYCPNCGTQTSEQLKYCKQCGANLRGVQEVMARGGGNTFDWSKTWVAEMFLSEEERERQRGITPEIKRLNEIKGGVITGVAGLSAMIFLYFLLGAVAAQENPRDAEIISKVWLVGIVPFFVGLAITFNGIFISKRIVELKRRQAQAPPQPTPIAAPSAAQLSEPSASFSVTEQTTRRIQDFAEPSRRETN
jgi:hypothetical protein